MTKDVVIDLDIELARQMLQVFGLQTDNMNDDEVFDKVLERIKCYGVSWVVK